MINAALSAPGYILKWTKSSFKNINPFTMMSLIIIFMAILTYIIPAGEFERIVDPDTGRTIVVSGSYQQVESSPVGIVDLFMSIPIGMSNGAVIIFMVFIVGGAIRVLEDIGTINAGISALINRFQGREILVICIVMVVMAIGGAVGAIAGAVLALIPLGIVVARSMKFDPVVGLSIMYIGAYSGHNTGPLIPYSVGLAQEIGGLALFSGAGVRTIIFLVTMAVGIIYVCRYAINVRKDPSKSVVADLNLEYDFDSSHYNSRPMNYRDWLVIACITTGIAALCYGAINFHWGMTHLSAIFLAIAIAAGLISGIGFNDTVASFVRGMSGITHGAMIIGFAYAIQYILLKGNVIDTIVYTLVNLAGDMPESLAAVSMFFANACINFLITSGSGQAATVMPIMFPVADLVGVSRQVAVTAFQLGDGFSNGIAPTSGILMAALATAKIPFTRWAKFYLPLLGWWTLIAVISIVLCVTFGWQ